MPMDKLSIQHTQYINLIKMAKAIDGLQNYNLVVKETDKKGNGLFTQKLIKEGESILEEKPLVSSQFSWNKTYNYTACEFCMRSLETAQNMARRLSTRYDLELPRAEQCCDISKQAQDFVKCPQCNEKYCCKECLQNAEQSYHSLLCIGSEKNNNQHPINLLEEAWKKIHYPPETGSVNIILKMIAMISKATNPEEIRQQFLQFHSKITDQSQKMVHKLLGDKFKDQLERIHTLMREVCQSLGLNDEIKSIDDLKTLFGLIGMNGQGIGTSSLSSYVHKIDALSLSDDERTKVDDTIDCAYDEISEVSGQFLNCEGSGLYEIQSRCNHSCEPNVEVTFPHNSSTLVLVALNDIQPEEELCICYLDDCQRGRSRHSRRKILRENYLFDCTCLRCEMEEGEISQTSSEEEDDDDDDDDEMEDNI